MLVVGDGLQFSNSWTKGGAFGVAHLSQTRSRGVVNTWERATRGCPRQRDKAGAKA